MLKASAFRASFFDAARSHSVPSILAGALVLACCGGCESYRQYQQQQQQEMLQEQEKKQVKETASTFLKSIPQSEYQTKWGLENLRLFGPPLLFTFYIDASKQDDSPLTYDAVAVVWCSGNTIEGHAVKMKRTVLMKVVQGQVTDYTLSDEESLSYWKQGAYWVWWSFLVPSVVLLITFFGIYGVWCFSEAVKWGCLQEMLSMIFMLVFIATINWWNDVALNSFGSWWVAALFWAVPLSLFGLIGFGILKAQKVKQ